MAVPIISVSGDINSVPYFKEAFLTLDTPPFIYGVTDKETDAELGLGLVTLATFWSRAKN